MGDGRRDGPHELKELAERVGAFPGHTAVEVGQFSDDGQWWWDGTTWIATSQIVLPQLPVTEFEKSGRLKGAAPADISSRQLV